MLTLPRLFCFVIIALMCCVAESRSDFERSELISEQNKRKSTIYILNDRTKWYFYGNSSFIYRSECAVCDSSTFVNPC